MKTHNVHQTKHQLRHNISRQVVFLEIQGNFKTIGFKLTGSGNITHYRFMGNMTGNIKGL